MIGGIITRGIGLHTDVYHIVTHGFESADQVTGYFVLLTFSLYIDQARSFMLNYESNKTFSLNLGY